MAKAKQMYYKFFQTAEQDLYRITKFDDDYNVVESYNTSLGKMWPPCNCPSYKRPCKHITMVKRWADNGCPENVVLNSLTDEFEEYLGDMLQ